MFEFNSLSLKVSSQIHQVHNQHDAALLLRFGPPQYLIDIADSFLAVADCTHVDVLFDLLFQPCKLASVVNQNCLVQLQVFIFDRSVV